MIDIIISTYNRADYLRGAILSVLAQTSDKFNLYVLDNCSTDHTRQVAEFFRSSGVHYIRNEKNLGMVGNWNRALGIGDSKYVQIFHDDDILEPNFVENVLVLASQDNSCAFIHTAANIIDEQGRLLKVQTERYSRVTKGDTVFNDYLSVGVKIICPSVVINRALIPDSIRFSEEYPFTADMHFWIRISAYGNIGYVSEPSIKYRTHGGSVTARHVDAIERKIEERFRYRDFLKAEMARRRIGYPGAADGYLATTLSADIWFSRLLGGSFADSLFVAYRCCVNVPSLLLYPRFYLAVVKTILPAAWSRVLSRLVRRGTFENKL